MIEVSEEDLSKALAVVAHVVKMLLSSKAAGVVGIYSEKLNI